MLELAITLFLSLLSVNEASNGINTDVYVKETFYSPVPILENVNSYSVLLEFSNVIVDKTLLIKQILECDRKVMIVALPRGFGKTVNIEMLKSFLEIEVDEWANELMPKNETSNYRMFAKGVWIPETMSEVHDFQTPLLISKHPQIIEQYQGQRPIIHLQFSQAIDITYNEFYLQIRKSIRQAFMDHDYLLNRYKDIFFFKNGTKDEIESAKCKMDLFNDRISLGKDESTVIDSIYQLSKLLAEYFDRPVFILIDEYDHLLLQVFKWVLDSPEGYQYRDVQTEQRVINFFRNWFGRIFHQNEFCEKAILNGRTLFCNDQLFAQVEDYITIDVFTNPFQEYYGFTSAEVEKLFDSVDVAEDVRQEARLWFDGYNLNLFSDLRVYNSFAIAGFLANQRVSNYWENEYALLYGRDIRRLFQFEPLRQFYIRLVQKETVELSLTDLRIDTAHRIHLANLLAAQKPNFKLQDPDSMVIIKELTVAGYLTNSGLSDDGNVMIRFPNMECASVCARILNMSIGNYSWLGDNTLFRFAPEYYDEIERIEKGIRTRRPNVIFYTPSRAPSYKRGTIKETYLMITLARTRKMRRVEHDILARDDRRKKSTLYVGDSSEEY